MPPTRSYGAIRLATPPADSKTPIAVGDNDPRLTLLTEIDSTGKTSAQIDALFTTVPANGRHLSDPTNHLVLVRQGGKWCKTAALTVIT